MIDDFQTTNRTIINARLLGYSGLQHVEIANGEIVAIDSKLKTQNSKLKTQNLNGDWLSLGGIDLQINGALGLAFPDLNADTADKLDPIADFLWQQGVDGYLPTLVTTSVDNIQRSLSIFAAKQRDQKTQESSLPSFSFASSILGIHLEGPFLNPAKRGAHPQEYLLPLTLDNVKRVLGDYASLVKIITLAPELDETGDVIPYLRSLGIIVSLGHSLATAEQAQRAFAQGATMVTHAFNAMPSLHHRSPGLLGAAIIAPQVRCGLIADGQHVDSIMMEVLLKAAQHDKGVFLVSDALSPLGLPDGIYPWDIRQIEVTHGTARLPDGTLSGTTLPLLTGVQNLVKWGICEVEQAIALATVAPRCAIGLEAGYIGQPAHLLRWSLQDSGQLSWQRLL
jgi:N-acetylglucosamine-6-phosphate deacetylase